METVTVKISAAMLRQQFRPCSPEFIRTVCGARCCESSTSPAGIVVTIHASERAAITDLGGVVDEAGMLRPVARRCPFKSPANLCGLHGTTAKPFGCIASPFTLNARGTLVVRNRYRLLKCYRAAGAVPAYQAHRGSLDRIFGAAEAARICAHLDAGGGDVSAAMPAESYRMLIDNDAAKHATPAGV